MFTMLMESTHNSVNKPSDDCCHVGRILEDDKYSPFNEDLTC